MKDKGCWRSQPKRRAGNLRTHELFPASFRKVSFHSHFKANCFALLAQWELEMSAGRQSALEMFLPATAESGLFN